MFVERLECSNCRAPHSHKEIQTVCKNCGSTLLVKYNLEEMKDKLKKEDLLGREGTLWRYFEFLPIKYRRDIITLGEGFTPILKASNLGFRSLWIKDESLNPTGTFKARGMAVAVSKARILGIKDIVLPSAGNAAAALSFYCAKAGIRAHVFMPEDSPDVTKRECIVSGADVHLVKGTIADAGKVAKAKAKEQGWFDMSTLKEPYRLEGKKTMGLEIAEYFNWELPDVVIYPTGGGTGLIGIWKAFQELKELGWISGEMPKMISVQASGCAPVVKAFKEDKESVEEWKNPKTIAAGLKVPKPFAGKLILKVLRDSNGFAISVTDEEIFNAIKDLARYEGIYACPEGAATYAGLKKLVNDGILSMDDRILLMNTGSGLKYLL